MSVINDEDYINLLNRITTNILTYLDKMNISKSDDKIKYYVEYLSKKTNISKLRLKTILTLDIDKKLMTKDIAKLAQAIDVTPSDLLKE